MNERVQLTHSNKPIKPKRTVVANRPSTEASKPWPRHTELPARDSRPLAGIGKEVEEGYVGLGEDRESRGVFVKEFVLVSTEKDEEVKEGEVGRDDVEMVYGGGVDDIPECGDDEMSQEHESEGGERDVVPDAQRSRVIGNPERPSLGKVKSDMANGVEVSCQTLRTQTTSKHSYLGHVYQDNMILGFHPRGLS
jgi:hypothetical protein